MIDRYAQLLVDYSLYLDKGEKLYIQSTTLAEPLLKEIYKLCIERGVLISIEMAIEGQQDFLLHHGNEHQLQHISSVYKEAMQTYDAYLFIRAPYHHDAIEYNEDKRKIFSEARKPYREAYYKRNGNGEMKRSLCQFPTSSSAELAKMSLEEYEQFIFNACKLYDADPKASWLELSKLQSEIINKLSQYKTIRYKNEFTDIQFSTAGRTWINSDGKTNMPSGEVYTSPVEDSVNGYILFDYPSRYFGEDVQDVRLKVESGVVTSWEAKKGKKILDKVFDIEGSRVFGEAAIGTNYNITQSTNNILFDEKIGGTVHMALGQSYPQAGGMNKSNIHWDLIANMKSGGRIYGDNEVIYEDGQFLL